MLTICCRTIFPPTEDDLSHTGEYDLNDDAPEDNLPTIQQTDPRATFEQVESPLMDTKHDELLSKNSPPDSQIGIDLVPASLARSELSE